MCSSGGQVASTDQALQSSQAAMTSTLNADYSQSFSAQQALLGQLQAKLSYMASNPMGYSPEYLHSATTSINENTASAAKRALGSAAAFAASHGAADVGGGGIAQVAGEIGSAAAQSKAQQLASLSQSSEQLKQQNLWNAISGLQNVGSQLGGAGGTAISGATSTASGAVSAGEGALQAQQAGWAPLSAISGLVKAGASMFSPITFGGGGGGGSSSWTPSED